MAQHSPLWEPSWRESIGGAHGGACSRNVPLRLGNRGEWVEAAQLLQRKFSIHNVCVWF